eukprot:gene5160-5239_t
MGAAAAVALGCLVHMAASTEALLPSAAAECEDSPTYTDMRGRGCAAYEGKLCAGGGALSPVALGPANGFPELHCCACGKQ